jgi:lambda family phage tail tape measure protein
MADLKYSVEIANGQALASLRQLESAAGRLTSIFTGLVAVLGTREIVQFADAITSVRNRLNQLAPTQEAVNQQFAAISAIAINARAPLESVSDLYFRIARNAESLGISQQEAGRITESVAKAISASGMSAAEASGPLLQLGQALQSGRFQGDELRSILEGLPPVARALANSLGVPIGALKELGSQGKITGQDFVKAMRDAGASIDQDFARTVPTIGQAFEQVKTSLKIAFDAFEQGSGVGRQLATSLEYLAATIYFAKDSTDAIIGPLVTFAKVLAVIASFTVVGRIVRGIGAAVQAAAASISGFVSLLGSVSAGVAALLGINKAEEAFKNVGKEGSDSAEIIRKFREEMARLSQDLPTQAGAGTPAYIDPTKLAKAREEITKISAAYQTQLGDQVKRLQLENSLVGASEQRRQITTALSDLEADYLKVVNDLMQKYRDAQIAGNEESAAKMKEIEQQLQTVSKAYSEQVNVVTRLTDENFRLNEAYKQRQALVEFAISSELGIQKQIRDIQHDIATSTLPAIEKKYADIEYSAREAARSQIESENSRRRSLGLAAMTAQEEQQYYAAAVKNLDKLKAAQRAQYDQARTWSAGWKKALNEYVDNATNAARRAEQVFGKMTSGLEDMIVNFTKTGKFEWRSFVNDMLETLLRSQIQQLLGSIFGQAGLLGGIGDLFGGLFGGGSQQTRGQTASNPLYVMDVAGGGGGMLGGFSTAPASNSSSGGLFSSIGNIFSGITNSIGSLFGGSTASRYGTNPGSQQTRMLAEQDAGFGGGLWDSITDFFGGFFANGGTLGAGRWGIAGERGPELITGPATITPMGAGGNVTYNINAVDAASFKALVAADPGFIHAVAMQGSMSIPSRR